MGQQDLVEELRTLGATKRGRYESTKLALMEACWKRWSTDYYEHALDRAVDAWRGEDADGSSNVIAGVATFIVWMTAAIFFVWGLKIMWGWVF